MKLLLLFLLVGCEAVPMGPPTKGPAIDEFTDYEEVCVKGVVYYRTAVHGGSVLTPAWYQSSQTITHYLRTCP